jgi:hypothetical protein
VCDLLTIQHLPAGHYLLILPGYAPEGSSKGVEILVLPPAAPPATASAGGTAGGGGGVDDFASHSNSSNSSDIRYLYNKGLGEDDLPVLISPSLPQPLIISAAACSPAVGLHIQIQGLNPTSNTSDTTTEQGSAEVIAVFTRHLPDSTCQAKPLPPDSSGSGGDLGFVPQWPCGGPSPAAYSNSIKLDSAIAYVLQRRQWLGRSRGKLRPGSLLERPSLLVNPKCVMSAASKVTVIKGGDGGKFAKKAAPRVGGPGRGMPAPGRGVMGRGPPMGFGAMMGRGAPMMGLGGGIPAMATMAMACPASFMQQQQAVRYGGYDANAYGAAPMACVAPSGGVGGFGYGAAGRGGGGVVREEAVTPSLGYCRTAVVLTGLRPGESGEVRVTPEKLKEMMGGVTLEVRGAGMGFKGLGKGLERLVGCCGIFAQVLGRGAGTQLTIGWVLWDF